MASRSAIGWVRFVAPRGHRQQPQALDQPHQHPEGRRLRADQDRGAQGGGRGRRAPAGSPRPRPARRCGGRRAGRPAPGRPGRPPAPRRRRWRRRRSSRRRGGRGRRSPGRRRPPSSAPGSRPRGSPRAPRGCRRPLSTSPVAASTPVARGQARGVAGQGAHGAVLGEQPVDQPAADVAGGSGHQLHFGSRPPRTRKERGKGEKPAVWGNREKSRFCGFVAGGPVKIVFLLLAAPDGGHQPVRARENIGRYGKGQEEACDVRGLLLPAEHAVRAEPG